MENIKKIRVESVFKGMLMGIVDNNLEVEGNISRSKVVRYYETNHKWHFLCLEEELQAGDCDYKLVPCNAYSCSKKGCNPQTVAKYILNNCFE